MNLSIIIVNIEESFDKIAKELILYYADIQESNSHLSLIKTIESKNVEV